MTKRIYLTYSILDGIFARKKGLSSVAGIGFHFIKDNTDDFYGKYDIGFFVGRFYLHYSSNFKLGFCRGFATGVGG